ncbi:hypothetical protein D0469_06085 [Peribacillus saganii]|uniref:Dihydrodiol dehydrogenase n=1 Tax=Peribacillus saganii TaxID=2303992 RepID=A0A372LRQ2_9BACI|nr:hypothetical protein [Peribacillus saganii]RFU70500.1 hypothetical protein D0469_06085 [Peribacillus saganii]
MSEVFMLKNEFAYVSVQVDQSANGDRLMITDVRTGKTSFFDPLELECLLWSTHKELTSFLDPSQTRWINETDDED